MHARQIAGVGQLPRKADRRVQALGEPLAERQDLARRQRTSITSEAARRASARRYEGLSASGTTVSIAASALSYCSRARDKLDQRAATSRT